MRVVHTGVQTTRGLRPSGWNGSSCNPLQEHVHERVQHAHEEHCRSGTTARASHLHVGHDLGPLAHHGVALALRLGCHGVHEDGEAAGGEGSNAGVNKLVV